MEPHPVTVGNPLSSLSALTDESVSQEVVRVARVDDLSEFGSGLDAWDAVYEQLTPGCFEGGIRELWIDEQLEILWEVGSQAVWTVGSNLEGMVSLGVPVASRGAGIYCGVPLDDGTMSFLPGGQEFEIYCRGRMDMVSATVAETLLMEFAAVEAPQVAEWMSGQPRVRQQPLHAAKLRRALAEIFRAVELHPKLLQIEASRRAMRDCVLSLVVEALDLNAKRSPWSLHPSAKAWIVRSVREHALNHPDDPLNIADICRQFRISRRSLQYAFEDLTGMGAVQFLRNVRLNAVRREIRRLALAPAESIASIAARWGFWHLPRFAEYYRGLFGELPSETRAKAVGSPSAVARLLDR